MDNYKFQFTDFALSKDGIHLLRNKFNFKTIRFDQLDYAIIAKGVETKHVLLTLLAGVGFLLAAIFQVIGVYQSFYDPNIFTIDVLSLIIPILPVMIGIYCIYIATKKIPLLSIKSGKEIHKLNFKEAIKNEQNKDIMHYLSLNLKAKLTVKEL